VGLGEILNPNDYQPGDERHPGSPYYNEPPEDEKTKDEMVLDWEVFSKDGDSLGIGKLTVEVEGLLEWIDDEQQYLIKEVKIKKYVLNGHTYTGSQVKTEFGEDNFDKALIEETVLDEIAAKKMYKIKQLR
jgi:hypothetical protein